MLLVSLSFFFVGLMYLFAAANVSGKGSSAFPSSANRFGFSSFKCIRERNRTKDLGDRFPPRTKTNFARINRDWRKAMHRNRYFIRMREAHPHKASRAFLSASLCKSSSVCHIDLHMRASRAPSTRDRV